MKKKILCILHLPPPVTGAGMVGSFIKKSKTINKTFDVDYINLASSFKLDKIGKGGVRKLFVLFKIQLKIIRALLSHDYDICYMTMTASGLGFYKDILVVAVLKMFGSNIIYHFHNKGVAENSETSFKRGLYRFVFNNVKCILLSPELYGDIADYVKKEDVYFCPNGIPAITPTKFEPSTESTICSFFFLSNMMEQKGVLILLEACKILKERSVPFDCHFVGAWSDVSETDFNKKVAQHGISNQIFVHGKKYGHHKIAHFKNADVFVFPTYYDCFPLVLLEAMQYALPVISTVTGGIPSIVEDQKTGVLLPETTATTLADTMQKFVADTEMRCRMGKAGRQRYENHFTLALFENRLKDILMEAASENV